MVAADGALVALGLFALPLTWWRRRTGYILAVVVGAVNVLGNLAAIAGGPPTRDLIIMGTQMVFSVVLIVALWKVWGESA